MNHIEVYKLIDKLQLLSNRLGDKTPVYIDLMPGLDKPEIETFINKDGLKCIKIC